MVGNLTQLEAHAEKDFKNLKKWSKNDVGEYAREFRDCTHITIRSYNNNAFQPMIRHGCATDFTDFCADYGERASFETEAEAVELAWKCFRARHLLIVVTEPPIGRSQ